VKKTFTQHLFNLRNIKIYYWLKYKTNNMTHLINYNSELIALWWCTNGLYDINNEEYNCDDKSFKYVYKFYIANGCFSFNGVSFCCVWDCGLNKS
jgi:hypothetical protein